MMQVISIILDVLNQIPKSPLVYFILAIYAVARLMRITSYLEGVLRALGSINEQLERLNNQALFATEALRKYREEMITLGGSIGRR